MVVLVGLIVIAQVYSCAVAIFSRRSSAISSSTLSFSLVFAVFVVLALAFSSGAVVVVGACGVFVLAAVSSGTKYNAAIAKAMTRSIMSAMAFAARRCFFCCPGVFSFFLTSFFFFGCFFLPR